MSTTAPSDLAPLRCRLRAAGYAPIPVAGKNPGFRNWQTLHDSNPDEIALWSAVYPYNTNTGILCRTTPAIDIDILNLDAARAVEDLAREHFEDGGYFLVRTGKAPKRAILLRTDEPFSKIACSLISNGGTDEKIELLGDGQQLVAFGIHPDTRQPYRWHGGEPGEIAREDLPYIHEYQARAFVEAAAELLCREHGYTRASERPKNNGDAQPGAGPADWGWLMENIRAGRELHDSTRDLAAKLIAAGMTDGAVVNFLRAQLDGATIAHDDRWQQRYDDIPRTVQSAATKYQHQESEQADLGEWDAGEDTATPPPRGWLLGNIFARKFMSSLLADGGVGKTAVRYAQLLSCATGRSLSGDHVFQRCKVLIVSLEDDADELRRRILALTLHYKIDRSELMGWLFLSAPGAAGGKIMGLDKFGRILRGSLADKLEAVIVARGIDVVSVDPFVKSHSVDENSNSAIDDVVQVLTDLATKHNIAIDAPHHTSKGTADPGNASRGRGASSMKDAARLVYTLAPMSTEEAQAFGIKEEDRRLLIRMDTGKINIAPPLRSAKWFRLVGVPIGNATSVYPSGDEVQAVEPWTPPDTWAGLSHHLLNQILTAIDAGLPDGNRYTDAPSATERAAWKVVLEQAPDKAETQAREVIKTWVKNGVLVAYDYINPSTRKPVKGLRLDPTKRPS